LSSEFGSLLNVIDPSTGATIANIAAATPAQIDAAVTRAHRAQVAWAAETIQNRRSALLAWRRALLQTGDQLALQLSRENGKPLHEAWLHEVAPLCDTLSWLADEGPHWLDDAEVSLRWMKHQRSLLWSKPRGVCAVIAPYNFPLLIPFADAAAALMAGCAVIVKPSERTPLIAQSVAQVAEQSGLEPGLLQVLPGGGEVAQALISSPIDEVVFTGSTEHGRAVAMKCAERLIPCTLELGGGAPAVVFADAQIEQAAEAIAFGALANSGQSCIAIERVYTLRSSHASLVEAIDVCVRRLRQGNPIDSEVDLGAMTSAQHLQRVSQQVDAAVERGATLVCGGTRGEGPGHFFRPTVLGNCIPEMAVVSEETFGPVIPIIPVEDVATMLELANRGNPSLAAYLFGRDRHVLNKAARGSKANHVLINDVLWSYLCPELPFGGHGPGGWGVVHGPQGLLSHTHRAHIGQTRMRLPGNLGFGFPYGRAPRTLLKHAMRFFTH
jgi:succinate-semialdehyde dehydrogenase/glutarate-semialdehyde dehydrogenase